MKKLMFLLVPMVALLVAATPAEAPKCHSEVFTKAKRKLDQMTLTRSQRASINTYAANFRTKWSRTHRHKGCSHHEAHAKEFVAAAAGVLTDDQFYKFQNRRRNRFEKVGNELWSTGQYLDNLIKIADSL